MSSKWGMAFLAACIVAVVLGGIIVDQLRKRAAYKEWEHQEYIEWIESTPSACYVKVPCGEKR